MPTTRTVEQRIEVDSGECYSGPVSNARLVRRLKVRGRPLFAMAVVAAFLPVSMTLAEDVREHLFQGRDLGSDDVAFLEARVVSEPHDLVARAQLLGYYFGQDHYSDGPIRRKRADHILWLIRNVPESTLLKGPEGQLTDYRHAEVREAWNDQIARNPGNTTVLYHAAEAFTLSERGLAIDLLQQAQSLDGSNPKWAMELGHLYDLDRDGASAEDAAATAEQALAAYERAYELSEDDMRGLLLVDLAKNAFVAKRYAKAREYAAGALDSNDDGWNHGNRIHFGHLVLGHIALAEGNIEEAKYRLIAAATIEGSPQLNSFGPDMSLAAELLEAGEKDTVLKYFELCAEFWELGQDELADWTALVTFDRTPDFSMNRDF